VVLVHLELLVPLECKELLGLRVLKEPLGLSELLVHQGQSA